MMIKKITLSLFTILLLQGCAGSKDNTFSSESTSDQIASLQNLQDGTFLAMHTNDDGGISVAILSPLNPDTATEANWAIEREDDNIIFKSIRFPELCAGYEKNGDEQFPQPEVIKCKDLKRKFTLTPLNNGAVIFTINVNGETLCLGAPRPSAIQFLTPTLNNCINNPNNTGPSGSIFPKYQWVVTSPQVEKSKIPTK